jgi:hypothetical protein
MPGYFQSVFGSMSAIFLFDSSGLIIDGADVTLDASIFLCDQSSLIITNSTFRQPNKNFFEKLFVTSGSSVVFMQGVQLRYSYSYDDPSPYRLASLHMIRSNSTFVAGIPPNGSYSIRTPRALDAFEFAALDNSNVVLLGADFFAELYIASSASMLIAYTKFFDIFFEACTHIPHAHPHTFLQRAVSHCKVQDKR